MLVTATADVLRVGTADVLWNTHHVDDFWVPVV